MSEAGTRIEALVPTVSAAQLVLAERACVIDLRSPGEFAADHVPGAHNVPLFDDVQRALIGTLYKRASPETAFAEGRRIVRARVRGLVEEVGRRAGWDPAATDLEHVVERMTSPGLARMSAELACAPCPVLPARAVVLHCWRGGLRSRSVIALLRALGLERAVGLEGGYKAWRRYTLETIAGFRAPSVYVLRGLTGVGKTLVLRALERARPGWTIDLEGLAQHRSSLLGMVGLQPRPQRMFESALAERIRRGFPGPLVLEGESRRVGDLTLPRTVWEPLSTGTDIELVAPFERRVEVLAGEYLATEASRAELRARLPDVEARMKRRPAAGTLVGLLDREDIPALVRVLLEDYYDPLYRRSEARHLAGRTGYALTLDASDPGAAARVIAAWIERRSAGRPDAGRRRSRLLRR